ncbi:RNA polymerase recycling motor HelD [Thalassobacillus pellis]|uniref:RNA polymerase recycling motor HelD n=1 Tax=Thalassobacillus pellis TaxID=748008 RepID=UPI0019603CA2|nr:RNA polymerase recycling motor HelD [Thalassobacillus pellis]MBM7551205.1 DNA helicase-2/ATP-dependent DNA helicase PcrA [Thalassobacillus pellis]
MENHPDYSQELERLDFTKAYMDTVIAAQEVDQEALKKKQEETLGKLDFKDSSLRYQEMLTHSSFMKMSKEQLENLKRLRKKPYFARINFQRKEKPEEEVFYIGKVSLFDRETQLPIILDWRSPLAHVYYEGRLGEISYEAHGEWYEGNVSLKRQYQIEDGKLKDFRDVDLTTKDELLQESLAQNADSRLSEIVSTIQEEQNQVIRADLRKPIIVQGAAGSGKTTIALHRISYFLYTMKDIFKPEEMLILAPNRLFIQYISEVLPELGVHRAKQTTYADFVYEVTKVKGRLITQHESLTSIIESTSRDNQLEMWMAEFKGSPAYKQAMDKYLQLVKKDFLIDKDFMVADFKIKSGQNIKRLFLEDYHYFPYKIRVQKIKAILQSELRRKKKVMLKKVKDKYDQALDRALFDMKDPDQRKVRVSFLMDKKQEKLARIEKESKTAVAKYMKQYPSPKLFNVYLRLFENKEVFEQIFKESEIDNSHKVYLREFTRKYLHKKKIQSEDLAALLYLHTFLFGVNKDNQAKKVVIDEAQDYSYFEIYSLRRAFQTELFTIVGDLAQGIYGYRGLKNWETLKADIFREPSYLTLQKTYRTTTEIMHLANQLLALMKDDLPLAEPVVRRGEKPSFLRKTDRWADEFKNVVNTEMKNEMRSFAIVTKTMEEAKRVHKEIKALKMDFLLLDEKEKMSNKMILPSYLAKGLEFDVVFLVADQNTYEEEQLDIKMLYVAMTRPLHRLYMIGKAPSDFLLNRIQPSSYQTR